MGLKSRKIFYTKVIKNDIWYTWACEKDFFYGKKYNKRVGQNKNESIIGDIWFLSSVTGYL